MKKSMIAAGAASAVLAAMPVLGVFAATEGSFKDNITVTVEGGCTLEVAGGTAGQYADRTFSATIAAGTAKELTGVETTTGDTTTTTAASAMSVTCNVPDPGQAWVITATADNNGNLQGATQGNVIPSGNTFSGTTSAFAYRLSNASEWLAVPTTANANITSGRTVSGTPTTFNPTYKVYVAPNQAPDTYTGGVTYTIGLSS